MQEITSRRKQAARDIIVDLIVSQNLPLSHVEAPAFKQLLKLFDPSLARVALYSRTSLASDIHIQFHELKQRLKHELKAATSAIHISFDLWTSPNQFAVLAVNSHYLDNTLTPQTRLLALKQQIGIHSGQNIALTLSGVVKDWGITKRVGVCVSDNAMSNDTCLQHFYTSLDPTFTSEDIRHRRIRCLGHIINLAARAFMYGANFDLFERQDAANVLLGDREADLQHWRRRGPIGKLHNICKLIRASPQRLERLRALADEVAEGGVESTSRLQPVINNDTRWNSTYLMIERALRKRSEISNFQYDQRNEIPEADQLSNGDWAMLNEIRIILKPLHSMTMKAQGNGRL
jgi:hypothetical protein